jgi:hypothetical protein
MATRTRLSRTRDVPRLAMLALGVWLFISAFLWPHTSAQRTNTWLVGALVVIVTLVSANDVRARYLNTALAVWLFLSVWILPTMMPGTVWNNLLVAVALFIASLAGRKEPGGRFARRVPA